jgi:hypothetical protein
MIRIGAHKKDRFLYDENELLHCDDGPAILQHFKNGRLRIVSYHQHGVNHRIDGPSHTRFFSNRRIASEEYYVNGIPHRIDGPALLYLNSDGSLHCEEWKVNGLQHRTDGPAYLRYENKTRYSKYKRAYQGWYLHGMHHNWNGISSQFYDNEGDYWLFGLSFREKEYNQLISMNRLDACLEILEFVKTDTEFHDDFYPLFYNAMIKELTAINSPAALNYALALQVL